MLKSNNSWTTDRGIQQEASFAPGQTAVGVEVEHWWTYNEQSANQI